jgi:hypothetical protein
MGGAKAHYGAFDVWHQSFAACMQAACGEPGQEFPCGGIFLLLRQCHRSWETNAPIGMRVPRFEKRC